VSARPKRQFHVTTSTTNVADLSLLQLAAAVREDRLSYEAVALEWERRKASGLDPSTGLAPTPVTPAPTIPAIACVHCGARSRAPIANEAAK